jgi:hypothetical protein
MQKDAQQDGRKIGQSGPAHAMAQLILAVQSIFP